MIFLSYFGKMVLCSTILFGYYWLFLRNRRFHHYNRFYLLLTLLLSVPLPLFRLPVLFQPENRVNQAVYKIAETVSLPVRTVAPAPASYPITRSTPPLLTLENGLWALYLAGAGYLLLLLGRSLYRIYRITQKYPARRGQPFRFYNTAEPGTPFSFFRSIFWNNGIDISTDQGKQIFRHELFHVRQRHSVDILFAEIVTVFGWFNPIFHLLKRELKTIHEFLADQHVIESSDRFAYATLLVQQAAHIQPISLLHYFLYHPIKRRIAMITQFNGTKYGYWSRAMALPVTAVLAGAITLKAQEIKPATQEKQSGTSTNIIPARQMSPAFKDTAKPVAKPVASTVKYEQAQPATVVHKPVADIDLKKVKAIERNKTTMQEIETWFGTPLEKNLANNAGLWVYQADTTQLRIEFDAATNLVTSYNYMSYHPKASIDFSYDEVRTIREGTTTPENMRQKFGDPKAIMLRPEQETWEYSNEKSHMYVEFGAGKQNATVVSSFRYSEINKPGPAKR